MSNNLHQHFLLLRLYVNICKDSFWFTSKKLRYLDYLRLGNFESVKCVIKIFVKIPSKLLIKCYNWSLEIKSRFSHNCVHLFGIFKPFTLDRTVVLVCKKVQFNLPVVNRVDFHHHLLAKFK